MKSESSSVLCSNFTLVLSGVGVDTGGGGQVINYLQIGEV